MHPYERALIERFNNAQSLVLDNKVVPTWTIDQSDPLNLGSYILDYLPTDGGMARNVRATRVLRIIDTEAGRHGHYPKKWIFRLGSVSCSSINSL